MSIFVDENTKVIYQGLTGSQGSYYGLLNRDYGTQVVAGTHPRQAPMSMVYPFSPMWLRRCRQRVPLRAVFSFPPQECAVR